MGKGQLNQEVRQILSCAIADIFIHYNITYPSAKLYIAKKCDQTITCPQYYNQMTIVVRKTFRRLEEYVAEYCQQNIRPIDNREVQTIKRPLIQCRKWMSPQLLETYFAVMRAAIKREKVDVSKQCIITLYQEVISLLKVPWKRDQIIKEKRNNMEWKMTTDKINKFCESRYDKTDVKMARKTEGECKRKRRAVLKVIDSQ